LALCTSRWALLQNIHLTIDWTSGPLNEKVDKLAEGAHKDFRLFLSAEPPPILEQVIIIFNNNYNYNKHAYAGATEYLYISKSPIGTH
jgi:hypothetical protein